MQVQSAESPSVQWTSNQSRLAGILANETDSSARRPSLEREPKMKPGVA
jgi:hypothetical protein